MYLLGKYILDLKPEDITQLIELGITEGKNLDYKRELNFVDENKDQGKSKINFLADISAMYNTEGGCIVYGIEEKKNNPGHPADIHEQNAGPIDAFDRKIQQLIKSGTEPAISNFAIKHLTVKEKNIFVIGIGKGLGLPSMIISNSANKFYRRNMSANYLVDVYELNQMFMQTHAVPEMAEQFKNQRIDKVLKGQAYPNLDIKGAFFVHAIPYSFLKNEILDFSTIKSPALQETIEPLTVATKLNRLYHSIEKVFNYDGFLTTKVYGNPERIFVYNQFFRNGIVEFYSNEFIIGKDEGSIDGDYVLGSPLVKGIIQSIRRATDFWKFYQVEPPFLVFVTLRVPTIYGSFAEMNTTRIGAFPKNNVDLPGIYFDRHDYSDKEIYNILTRYINILWQTAGKDGCPTADDFFTPSNLY